MAARLIILLLLFAVSGLAELAAAPPAESFPDFDQYEYPQMIVYHAPPLWLRLTDVGMLAAFLAVGIWALRGNRSRRYIQGALLTGLLYFGFIRHGCICPVGATGNVIAALTHPDFSLSEIVVILFFLPLLAALFWGRIFCGTACPLGAVQEFIAWRPFNVPRPLDLLLRTVKYGVLGLTVIYAVAYGTSFICQYDPLVTLFRWGSHGPLWLITAAFLVLCVFVARPFCRYLCPYGILLGLCALAAGRQMRVDAEKCVSCGRCEKLCPTGNIRRKQINVRTCLTCGVCRQGCPQRAIDGRNDADRG